MKDGPWVEFGRQQEAQHRLEIQERDREIKHLLEAVTRARMRLIGSDEIAAYKILHEALGRRPHGEVEPKSTVSEPCEHNWWSDRSGYVSCLKCGCVKHRGPE